VILGSSDGALCCQGTVITWSNILWRDIVPGEIFFKEGGRFVVHSYYLERFAVKPKE
jgi:hypothetical protein